jgi:hypothetical protein
MESSGSMRKTFHIPSPKTTIPQERPTPQLARRLRFPEIFEEDEGALKNHRCPSPKPMMYRKKPHSTSPASQPHVRARPCLSPPPILQVPIVATTQVNIGKSLLKTEQETDIAAEARPYHGCQQLELRV